MNALRSRAAVLAMALLFTSPVARHLSAQAGPVAGSARGAVNLGPVINSPDREAEATFTADGRTMYFNCLGRRADGGGNDVCVSTLDGDRWTEPRIVEPISSEQYIEVEPLLSPDGTRLYFMSNRPGGLGGMDIWVSRNVDGEWTDPENLGAPINSPYMDHCLFFAGDDWEIAYWTSTRPGGYGGNDIWTSVRVDGVWQEAVNLGPAVNTAASEHHSLPSADGRSLYITSDRPGGLGGEDIYVTTRLGDGSWGTPVNLGPLVNSEAHDRCPSFSPDLERVYFDSERPGGQGGKDLWWISFAEIAHIR